MTAIDKTEAKGKTTTWRYIPKSDESAVPERAPAGSATYTYKPKFDTEPSPPPAQEHQTYYRYDAPYAGRLSSAINHPTPQYFPSPAVVGPKEEPKSQPAPPAYPYYYHSVPMVLTPAPAHAPALAPAPASQYFYAVDIEQPPNVPAAYLHLHTSNPAAAPTLYTYQPIQAVPETALSSAPPETIAWIGSTASEVQRQDEASRAQEWEARQLAPYQPSTDDQFYCRELNGSYTLHTANEIEESCQPGYWKHGSAGYPYWVRVE